MTLGWRRLRGGVIEDTGAISTRYTSIDIIAVNVNNDASEQDIESDFDQPMMLQSTDSDTENNGLTGSQQRTIGSKREITANIVF